MKESNVHPWIKSLKLSPEWILISQGAEARVWKVPVDDKALLERHSFIICKERFPKKYRHPILDERLIKARVRAEVKALEKCYHAASEQQDELSLRVPNVLRVDPPLIYLEYLEGQPVRAYLEDLLEHQPESTASKEESTTTTTTSTTTRKLLLGLAKTMGKTIATLHSLGIVHGDLTTSNMMILPHKGADKESTATATAVTPNSSSVTVASTSSTDSTTFALALIDFGLAKNGTMSVEERAVDLYVLERALEATHPQVGDDFAQTLLESYGQHMNPQHDEATATASTTPTPTTSNKKQKQKKKTANSNNSGANGGNNNVKHYNTGDAILQRLDKVRQRGRKRECFG